MVETLKVNNKFAMLNSDSDNSDHEDKPVSKEVNKSEPKTKTNKATNLKSLKQSNGSNNSSANKQNSTNVSEKIEEEMFKQYYGKKVISKTNKSSNFNNKEYNKFSNTHSNTHSNTNTYPNTHSNSNDDNGGFIKVVSKKKEDKIVVECLYKEINEKTLDSQMDNYFKVLAHHNDDKSWDYNSYHNITTLKKWKELGSFFKCLNTVGGECNYTDFDIFIMKNEISPMWEDLENRNGSICSVKIDSLTEGYNIFKNLTINMANNTLLKFNPSNWNSINGISFSSKKLDNLTETYCIIIKIWFKINILNFGSVDKLLNDDINNLISRYSIKNKPIKPEY